MILFLEADKKAKRISFKYSKVDLKRTINLNQCNKKIKKATFLSIERSGMGIHQRKRRKKWLIRMVFQRKGA